MHQRSRLKHVSMNNWNHDPRYLTNNYSEILERGNIDTPDTHIHDLSVSVICASISITSGGVTLVLRSGMCVLGVDYLCCLFLKFFN